MKRLAVAALVLLALVPSAGAGGPAPLLAAEWRLGGGITLLRLHAGTLEPIRGTRIDVRYVHTVLARSPDRRHLALSGENQVRFVDLRTHKLSQPVYPAGWVERGLWTRPNHLVTVVNDEVLVVDRRVPKITRRVDLDGSVLASQRAGASLALLLGPDDGIGALSVALVDGAGNIRTIALDGLRGGRRTLRDEERNPVGMYEEVPGFAVDATGRRALVVGRTVAVDVDLVDRSSRARPIVLRSTQKRIEGWWRGALWLDATHVATFGSDFNGDHTPTTAPVRIVDLTDWSARTLETKTSYAVSQGGLLVTVGSDVRGYLPDGTERFRIVSDRVSGQVTAGETFLYVETSGRGKSWSVVDPADGRILARRTFARPMNILPGF